MCNRNQSHDFVQIADKQATLLGTIVPSCIFIFSDTRSQGPPGKFAEAMVFASCFGPFGSSYAARLWPTADSKRQQRWQRSGFLWLCKTVGGIERTSLFLGSFFAYFH